MKETSSNFKPRLVVEAIVIRACPTCGYKCEDPNCENCENCGCKRPEAEDLGVIFDNKVPADESILDKCIKWCKDNFAVDWMVKDGNK